MMSALLTWLSPLIPESRTTQAILIGSTVALTIYYLTKKRYNYPPGPMALPVIGNLLALRNTDLLEKTFEWQKKYGPVFTLHLGSMKTVMLNRWDVIHEAMVKNSTVFAGRPRIASMDVFTADGKDIFGTDYGPTWQLHRRLALRALGSYMKGNALQETMDDVLQMVMQEMRKEKGPFDIQIYADLVALNIISKICFSEMYNKDEEEFQQISLIFVKMNENFGNGFFEDAFPILKYWPTKKYTRLLETLDEFYDFLKKRINQHKSTFSQDVQRNFTDAMLIAQKELSAEGNPEIMEAITDTHFVQTISDVFIAGNDTSRQTIHWTILYIAAHPDVQAKIHEEVDSVLGARSTPLVSDRMNLPYTEAALYESMRIATVAPLGAPHATTCDTTFRGFTIPKGTVVMPNIYAAHHDPTFWKDPWEYRPERFLDSSGKIKRQEAWMPFSVGKRACMAESLAKPNLQMILAALYRNFEITLPEGVKADFEPVDTGFVYLAKPYKVVIKDRFA